MLTGDHFYRATGRTQNSLFKRRDYNDENSVCLCYACNKLQGTDSWTTFQKKLGREAVDTNKNIKNSLDTLGMAQLKFMATKLNIKVKSKVVEGWLSDSRVPPGKKDYIKALSKIATDSDIELAKTSVIDKPVVKKKKRKQSSSWW